MPGIEGGGFPPPEQPEDPINTLRSLREEGFTDGEIAQKMGRKISWVKTHRKLNGIPGMTAQESRNIRREHIRLAQAEQKKYNGEW